jgi:peroxiredoxin/outer membrane lipoprotein-sorting protein
MKTKQYLSAAAVLLAAAAWSGSAGAQGTSVPSPGDQLVQQSLAKLAASTTISADFVESDTFSGKYKNLLQKGSISLARPSSANIFVKRYRQVSAADPWQPSGNDTKTVLDGKTYTFAFLHPNSTQVTQSALTPRDLKRTLASVPTLAGFFATETNSQNTASEGLPNQAGPAILQPSETWEGASYQVVQYPISLRRGEDSNGDTAKAYIGSDLIIHRLVYSEANADGAETQEWDLRNITLNAPIDQSQFQYVVPKDSLPIGDRTAKSSLLENGTVAPDFTVYDRSGKEVHLSDYKGKTVVLDFWATWCWPCNQSLPSTNAEIQNANNSSVVALAVAINDSKKGFDSWLKKHNYPALTFLYDPTTKGPQDVTTLYQVTTQPVVYVIGKDGKIVSSFSGFTGPNDRLAQALKLAQPVTTASAL